MKATPKIVIRPGDLQGGAKGFRAFCPALLGTFPLLWRSDETIARRDGEAWLSKQK